MQPEKLKLSLTISRMFLQLDNLYDGNKELGDFANEFLNRNWHDVWVEINQSVFLTFSQIVENVLFNVFSTVPYDELFAKEENN